MSDTCTLQSKRDRLRKNLSTLLIFSSFFPTSTGNIHPKWSLCQRQAVIQPMCKSTALINRPGKLQISRRKFTFASAASARESPKVLPAFWKRRSWRNWRRINEGKFGGRSKAPLVLIDGKASKRWHFDSRKQSKKTTGGIFIQLPNSIAF